jgi:hypothetical protein
MAKSLILAAALVAVTASPGDLDPQSRAALGQWRLTDVGGKIACTLVLTSDASPGGRSVKAPFACRRAFPPLKDLSAWTLDPQSGLVFSTAEGARIVVFAPASGGTYEAKTSDGKSLRLEPSREPRQLSARQRMTGPFKLTGANGATLCDLSLTANLFGNAGSVVAGECAPGWSDKPFATWSLQDGRLVFRDRGRKPILVMKSQDSATFVVADSRNEPLTLVRK